MKAYRVPVAVARRLMPIAARDVHHIARLHSTLPDRFLGRDRVRLCVPIHGDGSGRTPDVPGFFARELNNDDVVIIPMDRKSGA